MNDFYTKCETEIKQLYERLAQARAKITKVNSYNTPETLDDELAYLNSQLSYMVSAYKEYFRELSNNLKARIVAQDQLLTGRETRAFLEQLIEFNLEANMIGVDPDFWRH